MRFSSVAISSIVLPLCGPGGTAILQAATPSGDATSLPSVLVDAPKHVARPQQPKPHAVSRSTMSSRTSPTTASPRSSVGKLANATGGSCAGGCATSFRTANAPWVGCSTSAWPATSGTCRNVGNYKTYAQCTEAGRATGWRAPEMSWYCSSLALR
jgi:hypothetical protein